MRVARIFPRRTRATPTDELAFTEPPGLFPPKVDEVRVSVTFSWDLPQAEWLARQWEHIAPVTIGGPAVGTRGEDFEPGVHLRPGYVITSRGCPNRCWFCDAWKRDGPVRELPIREGWNVLDDNLLACSRGHIEAVFSMLKGRSERAEFTGGLEARLLGGWHLDLLWDLKPKQIFLAYDTPDDWGPVADAAEMAWARGWTPSAHRWRCYVMIGQPGDTTEAADRRLRATASVGLLPMAMLWHDKSGVKRSSEWRKLQRLWARPAIAARKI